MTKFISVMWSEGVSEHESDVLVNAIDRLLKWLYLRNPSALAQPPIQARVFGNWVIPGLLPDRPYWGTQWYIDTSFSAELGCVIAPTFLELVRQEPWQKGDPHFDLALLDQDLTDFPVALARLEARSLYPGKQPPRPGCGHVCASPAPAHGRAGPRSRVAALGAPPSGPCLWGAFFGAGRGGGSPGPGDALHQSLRDATRFHRRGMGCSGAGRGEGRLAFL